MVLKLLCIDGYYPLEIQSLINPSGCILIQQINIIMKITRNELREIIREVITESTWQKTESIFCSTKKRKV